MSLMNLVGKCNSYLTYASDPRIILFDQFAVTAADQEVPILHTFGLDMCVAVTIYGSKLKQGLMAHFANRGRADELYFHYDMQFFAQDSAYTDESYVFEIFTNNATHDETIRLAGAIGRNFKNCRGLKIFKDPSTYGSIVFDTRTGKVEVTRQRRLDLMK